MRDADCYVELPQMLRMRSSDRAMIIYDNAMKFDETGCNIVGLSKLENFVD
jgi:hypothetical protein